MGTASITWPFMLRMGYTDTKALAQESGCSVPCKYDQYQVGDIILCASIQVGVGGISYTWCMFRIQAYSN